jgi:hypothetical protein
VKVLPISASEADVIGVVEQFVDLAAADQWPDALALVEPPTKESYVLSPNEAKNLVRNYGWPEPLADGSTVELTPVSTARGKSPNDDAVLWYEDVREDGAIGWVDYVVPLDGEWSDLCFQFEIYRREDGVRLMFWGMDVP